MKLDTELFSIAITGEWPGAGQSTTAKLLSQRLGLQRIYAGFLFRKFAHLWHSLKKDMDWDSFEYGISSGNIDLESSDFSEEDFNEGLLHQWQQDLKQSKDFDLWDRMIDLQSLKSLRKPGVVVEGKVAVVVDNIDFGLPMQATNHKVFKFLLTCTPEVSAQRVLERKVANGEIDTTQLDIEEYSKVVQKTRRKLIKRHLEDWKRYKKIYNLQRDDLYKKSILQIDTSAQNQDEVVAEIITLVKLGLKK